MLLIWRSRIHAALLSSLWSEIENFAQRLSSQLTVNALPPFSLAKPMNQGMVRPVLTPIENLPNKEDEYFYALIFG